MQIKSVHSHLIILLLFSIISFNPPSLLCATQTSISKELDNQYHQNFNAALKHQREGNFHSALEYFNSSLAIAKKNNFPDKQCDSLQKMGLMCWNLGMMERSKDLYRSAQTLADANNLKDRQNAIKVALNIHQNYQKGKEHRNSNQLEKSIASFQQAINQSKEINSKDHELKCLRQLSITYNFQNNLHNFNALNQKALEIAKELNHQREIGRCLNNIGIFHDELDNYSQALNNYENALKIARALNNENEESNLLNNISIIYKNLGNYNKAINYLEQVFASDLKTGDKTNIAKALNNLGDTYRQKGLTNNNIEDLHEALEKFKQSLILTQEAKDRKTEVQVLNNIGTVHADLNHSSDALEYFQKGLIIAEKVGDEEAKGMILNNMGIVHSNIGNFEMSSEYFQQAIDLAQKIEGGKILWEAYLELAATFSKQKKYDEALKAYKDSISTIENIRSQIDLEELKASYLGTNKRLEAYQEIINLLNTLHQGNRNKSYDKEAFEYLEKAKARAFLDRLAISPVNISAHVDFKLQNREKEIEKDISNILTKLYASGLSEEDNAFIQKELQEKEYEYETLKREIRTKNPAYADLVYPKIVTLEETQNHLLDSHTAFFEYLLGKEKSLAFVITKKDFQIFSLPSKEEIQKLVSNYLKALSDRENHDFRIGQDLFDILVSPGLNNKIDDIIFIPDDILHFLPFETLIGHQENWLIQDYNIAYTPSISAYKAIIARKKANGTKQPMDLLAFGDPDFGKLEAEDNTDNPTLKSDNGKSFFRLKYSGTEITKISRLFKKSKIKTFVRKEASEETLKNHRLDNYKIIHFATHSRVDNNRPTHSHIILSLDDDPTENGLLEAREIFNLKLNADLIILSACETGLGKFIKGEGIEGLNRTFFYAGSSSVLMSLWPVNDQATYQLMERFYTYLRDSEPIMDSLRKAKLEMIKSDVLSHPFYWAGFVISGKAGHIIFRKTYNAWIIPAALLLLMGIVIFIIKNKNGLLKKKI